MRTWAAIAAGIFLVLIIIGVAGGGGDKNSTENSSTVASSLGMQEAAIPTEQATSGDNEQPMAAPAAMESEEQAPQPQRATESVPREFQSAARKAKTYSDMMHMSRQGIYDQLVSEYGEQFSPDAAQYAVDNLQADYNKNALEKAKTYEKHMSMSPSAIFDQLTSEYGEKFTPEEAQYAVDNLGN
ncbi:hypothetical protein F7230_09680 [Corynebacterium sp. 320]|nr:hypothetical protein F7230_09680 [Corynebacterium sp. 320]KAB1551550.1 hypothetical protein F7233_08350 [Corynebacterium sp. 321]KAB1551983.1 hypothetical protein F7232_05925 [Corynebacterium sp. 319]KAB3525716.1 hypothetical protein F8354_09680 [Corynebacterium sp. 250]KAB3538977.1 hypothetical protein F8390_06480 [Corynebacterium sp. 366]QNP93148.1 Ltp family lipoprotein [Corynebacterium zhongnanshanii]